MDKKQRKFEADLASIEKLIENGWNAIYDNSKAHADMWGDQFIPIVMFDIIIEKSILKENDKADDIIVKYNNTIAALHGDLVNISKKNKSENIPLVNIRKGVDICKDQWNKTIHGIARIEDSEDIKVSEWEAWLSESNIEPRIAAIGLSAILKRFKKFSDLELAINGIKESDNQNESALKIFGKRGVAVAVILANHEAKEG